MNPLELNSNDATATIPSSESESSSATIRLLAATFGVVPWMFQGMHQPHQ